MAGTWLGRRRQERAHVKTVLLFVCVFIHTHALTQQAQTPQCRHGDYLNEERGICCNKCPPGFKLLKKCPGEGRTSTCERCPQGQYSDEINYAPNCMSCKRCKDSNNEFEASPCKYDRNTVCRCKDGFYRVEVDTVTYECRRCSRCRSDERERHMCTPTNDTICVCKEEHYRAGSRCEPCKQCSPECKHLCTSPPVLNTRADVHSSPFFINVIAGVVSVVVVMFVAATLVTHKVTKHFVKKRLNHRASQKPDDAPSPCEKVLIFSGEPPETSGATAYSTNDQEVSNLPDCIPLEIKTSDLIYTVLELVPVPQVKQLARSLGVNDTEIQEAELDYRPCREAHYQMLRAWAERGSRAGGGGRGGMLHRPLLKELLDKLRKMYLGQAAEELETKYDIQ